MTMQDQYREFARRVRRVERSRSRDRLRAWRRLRSGDMPWLIALVLSLMTGLVVGTFARITRFQLTGALPAETPVWTHLAMDFSLAFVAGVVLLQMIGIIGREHIVSLMIGVFATLMAFHIPVHWQPEIFALLFSAEWVATVLAGTPPDGLIIF